MSEDFRRLDKVIQERHARAGVVLAGERWQRDRNIWTFAVAAIVIVAAALVAMWKPGAQEPAEQPEPTRYASTVQARDRLGTGDLPEAQTSSRATTARNSERTSTKKNEVVGSGPFIVLEGMPAGSDVRFQRRRMSGAEQTGPGSDARRRVPSMNQRDFPEPESGCGPTAVVNWLLWLQQEGLLRKPIEGRGGLVLARYNFRSVEREIYALRGEKRDRLRGSSNIQEITAVMDRMAYQLSGGALRMHHKQFGAPLRVNDLLEFTVGYRMGILLVRIVENPETRALGGYHAVSLVAGDRAGSVMLNNWGEKVYGTLRNERDGQFFYPRNVEQPAMKVESAVCFIPFRPSKDLPIAALKSGGFSGRTSMVSAPRRGTTSPRVRSPQPPPTSRGKFRMIHSWSGSQNDSVFQITNTSGRPQAIYLKTFQAAFPSGRQLYPTDVRGARHSGTGFVPFGSTANLRLEPGESQLVWFRFNYLDAGKIGPRALIEMP